MRSVDNIVSLISGLTTDLQQIKNAQFLGRDSLLTYSTSSLAINDFSATVAPDEVKSFRVKFTFATAKAGAIVDIKPFYSIDEPDVMAHIAPRHPPTAPAVGLSWGVEDRDDISITWTITVSAFLLLGTYTAYVKLFFDGTDTGTWTLTAI